MDDLIDMITTDESPSQISDKIKDLLFAKAADRVDSLKPEVASSMFGNIFDDDSNVESEE